MNWQMKGVNSNYRSAKFEEISPKKTKDISRESFAFFLSHNIRHRIGICQDRHLSMREIPDHVHAQAYLCLRSCLFVCLLFICLSRLKVLAAIQLIWTCYTHPPIYSQRTASTPGTSSPTLLE